MPIPINYYVDITSGVSGASQVPTRNLNGMFITENTLVPTGSIVSFTSAIDVGTYFGTSSTEYSRAVFYFGWISKKNTAPNQISFGRWANIAVGSSIYGDVATYSVSSFTPVTTGDFTLTLGGFTHHLTGIDLSAAGSLSAIAADIQTAIRAFSGGGTAWTSATVVYNSTRKSFDLVSGTTGTDIISITAGVTTDVAVLLGWLTGAILSNGSDAQTISDVLGEIYTQTNNFGSFAFIPVLNLTQVTEAATWNNTLNVVFIYSVPVSIANAATWNAALSAVGGVTLTIAPLSTEYPEQVPMMIFGATDYTAPNSTQNYMFQQFNLTPSVTNSTDAATYDGLKINYYAQTQQAGTNISLYQRGVMFGTASDPSYQNLYTNEIWLKSAMTSSLMNLLLALSEIAADSIGRSQVLAIVQGVINQAVTNGTISVGKTLTQDQILVITQATNDPNAWQQVQNIGYWIDVQIESYVQDTLQQYKAVYTLIYSKNDVIRFIQGSDTLI
jgi:hypothetical protein